MCLLNVAGALVVEPTVRRLRLRVYVNLILRKCIPWEASFYLTLAYLRALIYYWKTRIYTRTKI